MRRLLVRGCSSIGTVRFGCHLLSQLRNFSSKSAAEPVVAAAQSASPPWLMLPSRWFDDSDGDDHHLFSVSEDKVIKIKKKFGISCRRHYFYPESDILCLGSSSYGWQALINKRNCELFLSNPLANRLILSNTIIPLPPVQSIRDCLSSSHHPVIISTTDTTESVDVDSEYKLIKDDSPISPEDMSKKVISKLVLSLPPLTTTTTTGDEDHCLSYNEDCFLMARTRLGPCRFIWCRPGDTSWTSLKATETTSLKDAMKAVVGPSELDDFTYFSNHQLFYSLTSRGLLESWDLRRPNSKSMRRLVYEGLPPIIQPTMDGFQIYLRDRCNLRYYHLVESSGDLLLVVRSCEQNLVFDCNGDNEEGEKTRECEHDLVLDCNVHNEEGEKIRECGHGLALDCNGDNEEREKIREFTVAFDVYNFDFIRKKWVYVPDLGDDRVLFLGLNSFSMTLSDNPGLQGSISGNCIYFSFAKAGLDDPGYHDSGLYNLNDGGITTFLPECFLSQKNQIQSSPPMWICPQL